MVCPNHKKELKEGKFGLFCPTPITKSADGTKVLEWCKYKPDEGTAEASKNTTPTVDKPVKETPAEEDKVQGMVRHGLVCALIEKRGLEPITQGDIDLLKGWEEYIMTGTVKNFPSPYPKTNEDLTEDEVDRILNEE